MSSLHPDRKIPYISLCSGYEGIGLGLQRCLPNLRTVAYCEREAFSIGNLVKKVEAGLLDAAPVYTDVASFPYREFHPIMGQGIVSAGFPCQPVSCAGKRKATEDERWLFDILCDGFELMQPGAIFFENVDGLLSAKMPDGTLVIAHIVTRLEKMDYRVEVGVFSAAEVGAPHQRKRVFILAVRDDVANGHVAGSQGRFGGELQERKGELSSRTCGSWPSRPGERQHCWEPPRTAGVGVADAQKHDGRGLCERRSTQRSGFGCGGGEPVADNQFQRDDGRERDASLAGEDAGTTGGVKAERETQPPMGRDLDGPPDRMDTAFLHVSTDNRVDELRLLGNGVVPATAEKAFRTLWGRFFRRGLGHAHGA